MSEEKAEATSLLSSVAKDGQPRGSPTLEPQIPQPCTGTVWVQCSLESDIMCLLALGLETPGSLQKGKSAVHLWLPPVPYQESVPTLGGTHWLTKNRGFCKHPATVRRPLDPKLSFSQC